MYNISINILFSNARVKSLVYYISSIKEFP